MVSTVLGLAVLFVGSVLSEYSPPIGPTSKQADLVRVPEAERKAEAINLGPLLQKIRDKREKIESHFLYLSAHLKEDVSSVTPEEHLQRIACWSFAAGALRESARLDSSMTALIRNLTESPTVTVADVEMTRGVALFVQVEIDSLTMDMDKAVECSGFPASLPGSGSPSYPRYSR